MKRRNQREDRLNTKRTDEGKFLSNLRQNIDTLAMTPRQARITLIQKHETWLFKRFIHTVNFISWARIRSERKDKLEQGQGNLFFKDLK